MYVFKYILCVSSHVTHLNELVKAIETLLGKQNSFFMQFFENSKVDVLLRQLCPAKWIIVNKIILNSRVGVG